jgi:hypothetical protein
MGAVAKDPITQLMLGPAQAVPWLLVNTPATAMRMMDPNEMRKLPHFAAIIVLVPECATYSKSDSVKTTGNSSLAETSRTAVLDLIEKRAIPSNANGEKSELAFGDVKVSFSSMEASRKGEPVKLTRWNSRRCNTSRKIRGASLHGTNC